MEEPRLMVIDWIDCAWNSSVYDLEELHEFKLVNMCTVGFGLEKEDRYILAKEKCGTGYRHVTAIPKINITKVTLLRKGV